MLVLAGSGSGGSGVLVVDDVGFVPGDGDSISGGGDRRVRALPATPAGDWPARGRARGVVVDAESSPGLSSSRPDVSGDARCATRAAPRGAMMPATPRSTSERDRPSTSSVVCRLLTEIRTARRPAQVVPLIHATRAAARGRGVGLLVRSRSGSTRLERRRWRPRRPARRSPGREPLWGHSGSTTGDAAAAERADRGVDGSRGRGARTRASVDLGRAGRPRRSGSTAGLTDTRRCGVWRAQKTIRVVGTLAARRGPVGALGTATRCAKRAGRSRGRRRRRREPGRRRRPRRRTPRA